MQLPTAQVLQLNSIEVSSSVAGLLGVRLTLSDGVTILVGKNGAGKSAIMSAICKTAHTILEPASPVEFSGVSIVCEFALNGTPKYRFSYERKVSLGETTDPPKFTFIERCVEIPTRAVLWRGRDGRYRRQTSHLRTPPSASLLSLPLPPNLEGVETASIREFFRGVVMVAAGVPRPNEERTGCLLQKQSTGWTSMYFKGSRLGQMVTRMATMWDQDKAAFDELNSILSRIGGPQLSIVSLQYREPKGDAPHYAFIRAGDDDIGVVSDGTLRVIEILIALLDPATKLLFIEEPETGIHPGLLGKLLAEIDAYAVDRQVVLSTHNHQVANRSMPSSVRLVRREDGATTISALSATKHAQLERYLAEDGTVGEFLLTEA